MYNIIKTLTNKRISGNCNIKDKHGNTLSTEQEIMQRWVEYVEDLYDDTDRPLKIKHEVSQYKKVHIDREEVKSIIESLPTGKATGTDEIPAELLQHMGIEGITLMTRVIDNCYNTGELSQEFVSTTFITIPKVPGTQQCNEHRTISLISHASKVLLKVIKSRITPLIESRLGDRQLGFTKSRGTRDGICQLRIMAERLIEKKKKLLICYIDYKKGVGQSRTHFSQ